MPRGQQGLRTNVQAGRRMRSMSDSTEQETGSMSDQSAAFTATRDELIDALTRLDVRVLVSGPIAGMINAESMADCIMEALNEARRR
jgi:hypothetical protein